jgi:hypothetical protein
MKSFKQYINEANYARFLKKNKNLTKAEIDKIDDFFTTVNGAVKKFESEYGSLQSKSVHELEYDDFLKIMKQYNYGTSLNLNKIKVQGKKGVDYLPVKLKNKKYIANIPLNQKTANYLNSCEYGNLKVNYCIGHDKNDKYFYNYLYRYGQVPVYIVDGFSKWVVMIHRNNKSFDVWNKLNKPTSMSNDDETIPDFSIKKELIQGKAKFYDDIRKAYSKTKHKVEYFRLIDDINSAFDSTEIWLKDTQIEYLKRYIDYDRYLELKTEFDDYSLRYKLNNRTPHDFKFYVEKLTIIGNEVAEINKKLIDVYWNSKPNNR